MDSFTALHREENGAQKLGAVKNLKHIGKYFMNVLEEISYKWWCETLRKCVFRMVWSGYWKHYLHELLPFRTQPRSLLMFLSLTISRYSHVIKEMVSYSCVVSCYGLPKYWKVWPAVIPIYKTYSKNGSNLLRLQKAISISIFLLNITWKFRKSSHFNSFPVEQRGMGWNCNRNVCHFPSPWNGGHLYINGKRRGYPPR